jgi:large subunit ribosomal protein L4
MQAKIVALDGSEKGQAQLPDALFGKQPNEHVLWLAVKRHLGNQRQGTAAVKNRGQVSGGGKKPFKQKGTGRARQGSNTSPLMPGGGRAFGPQPRSYRTELPKAQRRAALASALSHKAQEDKITVLESFAIPENKTKHVVAILGKLGVGGERTLLVTHESNEGLWRSCRNIKNLKATLAHQVNAYDVIEADRVLVTTAGLQRMQEVFAK